MLDLLLLQENEELQSPELHTCRPDFGNHEVEHLGFSFMNMALNYKCKCRCGKELFFDTEKFKQYSGLPH